MKIFDWIKSWFKTEKVFQIDIEVFRDAKFEWRWRAIAKNNKIVADGGESYKNKEDCIAMMKTLINPSIIENTKVES